MDRRDFLKGLTATGMLAGARANASPSDIDSRVTKISAFDYEGVRLHEVAGMISICTRASSTSTYRMMTSCRDSAPRRDCPRRASRWEDGAPKTAPRSSASG